MTRRLSLQQIKALGVTLTRDEYLSYQLDGRLPWEKVKPVFEREHYGDFLHVSRAEGGCNKPNEMGPIYED